MADAFLARYTLVPLDDLAPGATVGDRLADAVRAWVTELAGGQARGDTGDTPMAAGEDAGAVGPTCDVPLLGWERPVRWGSGHQGGAVELRWSPYRERGTGGVVERVTCVVRHPDPTDPALRWTTRLEFLCEPHAPPERSGHASAPTEVMSPVPAPRSAAGGSAGASAPTVFGAALQAALIAGRRPTPTKGLRTKRHTPPSAPVVRACTTPHTTSRAALVLRVQPAMTSAGSAGGASLRFAPPPALLASLVERFAVVGADGTPLPRRAFRLRAGGMGDFVQHVLCDPARVMPVVVLTPCEVPIPPAWEPAWEPASDEPTDGAADREGATARPPGGETTGRAPEALAERVGTFVVPPDALAAECLGVADVYVIECPEHTFALTDQLGRKELSVFLGALRAYLPGFALDADPYAHPLVLAGRAADAGARGALLRRLAHESVRRHVADPALDARLEHWADRARQAHEGAVVADPSRAAGRAGSGDASEGNALESDVAALRAEVALLRELLDDVRAENTQLRTELREARQEARDEARWNGRERRDETAAVTWGPPGQPASVAEAVEQAAIAFADALYILPSALRAARSSAYRHPAEVWRQLAGLARVARQMQEGSLGGALHQAFRAMGLDYAPGVSRSTGDRLRQQYAFRDGGTTYVCEEHLRKGNDPADGLRLYFTTRQLVEGRIVVGHVGAHLRTATTN